MRKPTQQEIKDCIAYFKRVEIYAYENDDGKVLVNFDFEDICVEISDGEVIERAKLWNIEKY